MSDCNIPADFDPAVEAFHQALDLAGPEVAHDRDGDFVDGPASSVVSALLTDGWKPPSDGNLNFDPSWLPSSRPPSGCSPTPEEPPAGTQPEETLQ